MTKKWIEVNDLSCSQCSTNKHSTTVDNAKDLDIVMQMYNIKRQLLYDGRKFVNWYRDEINYAVYEKKNLIRRCHKTTTMIPFEYQTMIIGRTPGNNNTL